MLVVAISGVIGAVVVAVHLAQERIYVSEDAYMDMYRSTRTAIDKITGNLRMAGYDPIGGTSFDPGIRFADSDSMVMIADYNGDGVPNSGDTVIYTSRKFSSMGIDSLRFAYLDENHDSLLPPVPADSLPHINSVMITVVMIRDEGLAGPHRYELTREVKLRN
jgi:hypothetical protein